MKPDIKSVRVKNIPTISFTALLTLLIFNSCGPTMSIYSDYDKEVHFNEYQTYSWAQMDITESTLNPIYYNELMDKRIKEAVDLQLKTKNYVRVAQDGDFVLHYHIMVEDMMSVDTDPYGYYGPYWRRNRVNVYQHKQGTLIIDFMDYDSKNLLWRGWAVSAFSSQRLEKMDENVKEAVYRIMEKYPFKAQQPAN